MFMRERLPLPQPVDLIDLILQTIPAESVDDCVNFVDEKKEGKGQRGHRIRVRVRHLNDFVSDDGNSATNIFETYKKRRDGDDDFNYTQEVEDLIKNLRTCKSRGNEFPLTVVTYREPENREEIEGYPKKYMTLIKPPKGEQMGIGVIGISPFIDGTTTPQIDITCRDDQIDVEKVVTRNLL